MIGLDANVLLRWLVDESVWPADDRDQARAVEALIVGSNETFFINHIVLAEAVWVLSDGMGQPKSMIVDIVERLLLSTNVIMDRREAVSSALEGYRKGKPGFTDHLIGHVNRHAGCTHTASFDKGTRRSDLYRLVPSAARRDK